MSKQISDCREQKGREKGKMSEDEEDLSVVVWRGPCPFSHISASSSSSSSSSSSPFSLHVSRIFSPIYSHDISDQLID